MNQNEKILIEDQSAAEWFYLESVKKRIWDEISKKLKHEIDRYLNF